MLRLLRGENPLVLVPTPSASQQRVITSPLKQNAVRYILSTRSCDALDGHWTRFIRLKSDNSGNGRNWYKLTLVDQTSSILLMILVNKKRLKVLFSRLLSTAGAAMANTIFICSISSTLLSPGWREK